MLIPPDIARLIEARSQESGLSLNKTVLRLLEETLGASVSATPGRRYGDLDDIAGAWAADEAGEFDSALAEQRQVDPELWK